MATITLITIVFLLTGASYGKDLDLNETISPRKAGFRFEDDPDFSSHDTNSHITFGNQPEPFKFDESSNLDQREPSGQIIFQDDNRIGNTGQKKKRRRRRKPRYELVPGQYPGVPLPGQGPYSGFPGQPLPGQVPYPGVPGQSLPGQGFYPGLPGQPLPDQGAFNGFPGQSFPDVGSGFAPASVGPAGQYYRPPRRPKPSFAYEALSRVTEALTSIALYDDYQCVPRLLCEAAGGGALGSSSVLQKVAGLQPLLTLLAAYNGISSSPLFVFGRAVFLGMTSKENTASCRYAYPQCPTDPEQLVNYLNNHNGGFFRFFNAPQQQIPQNLEQFYSQLSGYGLAQPNPQQNYGLYDPQNGAQPFNPQVDPSHQQYGLQVPQNYQYANGQVNQNPQYYPGQQYGLQNIQANPQQFAVPNPGQQNYGYYNPQLYQTPNQYGLYNQPSALQYPYANDYGYGYNKRRKPNKNKYAFNDVRFKDSGAEGNRIEKRIQNKPNYEYIDINDHYKQDEYIANNFKWIFPEDTYNKQNPINNQVRGGKNLKFPSENNALDIPVNDNSNRKAKSITFPGSQSNKYVNYYEYPPVNNNFASLNYQNYNVGSAVVTNNNNYKPYANDNNNRYVHNNPFQSSGDEIETVYIVRDDPNNPEIVKIRRGLIIK